MAVTEHADDLCVVLCLRRSRTRGCFCWKFSLALLHGARTIFVGNEKWDQISYTPKLCLIDLDLVSRISVICLRIGKMDSAVRALAWAKILEDKTRKKNPHSQNTVNANGEIFLIHRVLELLPQYLGICCCLMLWFQPPKAEDAKMAVAVYKG